ncbi:hypothetical protein WN48_00132 [Eufriesea mexicana]|uniref:PBZ-type domain-containing protein n=1 Tax=Eufriesea mexicana TaxID=516756 RepID=A0A310SHB5_9HYME|nr:hypothetical protein WN48_00132 [Eufriesea mexicana]
MSDNEGEQFKVYKNDTRIPCKYGIKCYQKNAVHHKKYKHPPTKEIKLQKEDNEIFYEDLHSAVSTIKNNIPENNDNLCKVIKISENLSHTETVKNLNNLITIRSVLKGANINIENDKIPSAIAKTIISHLFLTDMPEDFFQFYEFCKSISEKDPLNALKDLHLQLVGPYDIFKEGFVNCKIKDKEALLCHWRYYYDPPEFQTIIKDNGIDGLHFGYWRDDILETPVFVAKNKATLNCIFEPIAENIFSSLNEYIREKLILASPFEKIRIAQLHQKLKNFAKKKKISLEKKTENMQAREKQVVTRTFHKAGIVVPYNNKTQLGYRDLAVTDNELQKILEQIEHTLTPEAKKIWVAKLEEIIRLAIIAADECDFGTVLELGHDLFSSGVSSIQTKTLNLLSLAYNFLQRPQLLHIVQAHLKNRSKSLDLSVLQFD